MNRESSSLSPPIVMLEVRFSGSGSVVEHLLAKEKVAGSIPVSRSNYLNSVLCHVQCRLRMKLCALKGQASPGFSYGKSRNRLQ